MHPLHARRLAAMLLSFVFIATVWLAPAGAAAQDEAAPASGPCASVEATPTGAMSGMDMGSPMAGMAMEMEFDQLYIDMMIPHHESIIAMSEAALTRLEDERLREIAQAVVATQRPEVEELRGLRERLYGGAEPTAMDEHMMAMMGQMMPGMGSMDEMAAQMDPVAQVAAICGAEDADLAFIDLTIPHHEMAITASEAALDQATSEEVRAIAQRVIDAQRAEIEELTEIRRELYGSATPETVGS